MHAIFWDVVEQEPESTAQACSPFFPLQAAHFLQNLSKFHCIDEENFETTQIEILFAFNLLSLFVMKF